jgi:uncharacterized protein (DUF1778 family)
MSDKRKRQNAIRFRVNSNEEKLIRTTADNAKLPIASFAREATISAAKKSPETTGAKSKAAAMRNIVEELNHIATVTRKRAIHTEDALRVVDELRRLQLLLFRFFREQP